MGFLDWFGQKLEDAKGFGAKVLGDASGFGQKLHKGLNEIISNAEDIPGVSEAFSAPIGIAKGVSQLLDFGSGLAQNASNLLSGGEARNLPELTMKNMPLGRPKAKLLELTDRSPGSRVVSLQNINRRQRN